MTHPLILPILELATPIAHRLDLEIVDVVFHTHKQPPVLRLDIRNRQQDTGLDDCEAFSREIEAQLEATALIPHAYVLEVSSPGISPYLSSERDFLAFQGFKVLVTLSEPYQGQHQWQGTLQSRDQNHLYLHLKGRAFGIPSSLIATVQLTD